MAVVAKVNKKVAIRATVGMGVVALLLAGLNYLMNLGTDIDPGTFDSKGMIAALKQTKDGFQTVIVKPDGSVIESPGFVEGSSDLSPVWKLDGSRLFFVSDRDNREPHLFRWNPGRNVVDRRSLDRRSKNNLSLHSRYPEEILMVSGGTVIMMDPHKAKAGQVLPPMSRSLTGAETTEEGGRGQFEQIYKQLGTSFRDAKWCGDGTWIAAVMRREEGGEVLVLQSMGVDEKGNPIPVMPVMSGDKIEFDVSPSTGEVVFTCLNFQYLNDEQIPPENKKNGKITKAFQHLMGVIDPGSAKPAMKTIVVTPNDQASFNRPRFSPDGASILCSVGPYMGDGIQQIKDLVLFPNKQAGGAEARGVIAGDINDYVWDKSGEKIYFSIKIGTSKPIFSVNKDGTGRTQITKDGVFRNPVPSPQ